MQRLVRDICSFCNKGKHGNQTLVTLLTKITMVTRQSMVTLPAKVTMVTRQSMVTALAKVTMITNQW